MGLSKFDGELSQALDHLRLLARNDLTMWWKQIDKPKMVNGIERSPFHLDVSDAYTVPFHEIAEIYGDQAAYTTADYLFLKRSLDDHLAGLEYPDTAAPVTFEQAKSSFEFAVRTSRNKGVFRDDVALSKLLGIMDRLVTQPSRETVLQATQKAGTGYARVPEPGACAFCLMLASRGAVYTRETALTVGTARAPRGGREVGQSYHDNCRCLAIEVASDHELPQINKDLEALWDEHAKDEEDKFKSFKEVIKKREAVIKESKTWPAYESIKVPKYLKRKSSPVFEDEPLPDLEKMPGHVLWGWKDKTPESGADPLHLETTRAGHRHDSLRAGATKFPKDWSDQKIVDAVRDVLEAEDSIGWEKGQKRTVVYTVDDVEIQVDYKVKPSGETYGLTAYPIGGKGVTRND